MEEKLWGNCIFFIEIQNNCRKIIVILRLKYKTKINNIIFYFIILKWNELNNRVIIKIFTGKYTTQI